MHLNHSCQRVSSGKSIKVLSCVFIGILARFCSVHCSPILQDDDALPEITDNQIRATPITKCVDMRLEEGQYEIRSFGTEQTCGFYISTDPDKQVVVSFDYIDVTCANGGLISVVDGWELGGELFPGSNDHPKAMNHRFHQFCGARKPKSRYMSSQNVAMIQYRIPTQGEGFQITVQFVKNLSPCSVLLQGTEGVYTLRNYGQRSNCSVAAIFPSHIEVLSTSIGVQGKSASVEIETGLKNKCPERGVQDYVEIVGTDGLDPSLTSPSLTMCGMESNPKNLFININCGTSSVRLVSSGKFENSISVSFRSLELEEMLSPHVMCETII